jgi:hypothetical protein
MTAPSPRAKRGECLYPGLQAAIRPWGYKAASSIHDEVAAAAKALAAESAEELLKVESLAGSAIRVTAIQPLTGAEARRVQNTCDINLAFTVLTNDRPEAVVRWAFDGLRRASQAMALINRSAGQRLRDGY